MPMLATVPRTQRRARRQTWGRRRFQNSAYRGGCIGVLAGQYYDAETGLFQNWYRDYNPNLGRYVESDPIGLVGGINTYGYVSANPLRNVDPKGLQQADLPPYQPPSPIDSVNACTTNPVACKPPPETPAQQCKREHTQCEQDEYQRFIDADVDCKMEIGGEDYTNCMIGAVSGHQMALYLCGREYERCLERCNGGASP